MASPVRLKNHGYTHAIVMSWLGAYSLINPGVDLGENATVRIYFSSYGASRSSC